LTVTGTSSFKTDANNEAITLNTSTNVLRGAVSFTTVGAAGNASLKNSGGTLLGTSTVGGTLSVQDTTGTIDQTAGTITATTLTVDATGGIGLGNANQVANLAASTNIGGGGFLFNDASALTVTGAINSGSGTLALLSSGALVVNGTLTAGTNVQLTGASINLAANLTAGGTAALNSTGGNLSETGGAIVNAPNLILSSAGTVVFNDANTVTTLAGQSAGAFQFVNANVLTIGSVAGSNASFPGGGSASFAAASGVSTTAGDVRLRTNSGDLLLAKNVGAGNGSNNVALVSTTGNVTESNGAIVTASGLIIDAAGNATFASANNVATLAGRATTGSILFTDTRGLTIGSVPAVADVASQGTLSAGLNVTLTSTNGGVTILGNITADPGGNLLVTSAGAVTITGTITLTATNNIVFASGGPFTQSGTLIIVGPDLVISTTGSTPNATALSAGGPYTTAADINTLALLAGSSANPITFATLQATDTVLLLLANSGIITGTDVNVLQLGVYAFGASATLSGSIGGNASTTAAETAIFFPSPSNNYRFNTCAIGSVSCVVLPSVTPIQPAPIGGFAVLVAPQPEDDIDAPLTNIFDEDQLCDQLFRTSPDVARKVCR